MKPIHNTFLLIVAAFCYAATLHAADAPVAASTLSVMTNHAVWKDGRPVALPEVSRPAVEGVMLFEPKETDWKYSHHQSITAFKGQLFAIWSSSQRDEDSPGQRVMYAYRNEKGWIQPRILFQPDIEPDGRLRILTAAGFHQHNGTLVAYAGDYSSYMPFIVRALVGKYLLHNPPEPLRLYGKRDELKSRLFATIGNDEGAMRRIMESLSLPDVLKI